MSSKFITNQDTLVSEIFEKIFPTTESVYILVGYFYFSGFEEIYKGLADKSCKILVGLDVEKDILNKVREFEIIDTVNNSSRQKIKDNYYETFVKIFNDTDFFDSENKKNAFKVFLEKIKNGSLEIKKTEYPNHSKLYLFEKKEELNEGGEYPGVVITGSSNLTRAGLSARHEINVVFRDEHYSEAKEIFDSLWRTAITIVDKDTIPEFMDKVVEKIWFDKLYSPFMLYVRVLEEYFSFQKEHSIKLPSEITKDKFFNLEYQIDAIEQSIAIINKHNGVIIADVVGLGKSIIASAVAHNLGMDTIIIAPPHLCNQWEDYRISFSVNAKVYSSGKISKALEEDVDSHEKLIIIDEAHKYRNPETQDYAELHKLCQNKKVILLTATPFNNRPQDIFSMISLFQIPAKSTIRTVENLSYIFHELIKEYKKIVKDQKDKLDNPGNIKKRIKEVAKQIRDIIAPLVIRRTRIDLEEIDTYRINLKEQGFSIPVVKEPELKTYELGDLAGLYEWTLEKIAPFDNKRGFVGARYKPLTYLKDEYKVEIAKEYSTENLYRTAQLNLAGFMKKLLVRRFESSKNAFILSLDSMISSYEIYKKWYEELKEIPIFKKGKLPDVEELIQSCGEDIENELSDILDERLEKYYEKGLKIVPINYLEPTFIEALTNDIELLKNIKKEWEKQVAEKDPKLDHFKDILVKELIKDPARKIIVFTEFSDTADYLEKKLNGVLRLFKYSSKVASETSKQIVKENFDAGSKIQKNDFDVLIATDAISEGFNLHRAGTVINYDIPYNPTRVIQRVGRINRINKKMFEELYIFNYFPTATGENETRTKEISTLKIAMINALIGEDTKVLTNEEELESHFLNQYREKLATQEERSWDIEYRNFLGNLRAGQKSILSEALAIPKRVRINRKESRSHKGIIVFAKKGTDYTFKINTGEEIISLNAQDAIEIFKAEPSEQPFEVTEKFENLYQELKKNLFLKKVYRTHEKGKSEAIAKLKELINILPRHKDYLTDLLNVLEKLDSLPERYIKMIREIDDKRLNEDIKKYMAEVNANYLKEIIERANRIDDGEESLILSEELV